jgi:hypothetical protein
VEKKRKERKEKKRVEFIAVLHSKQHGCQAKRKEEEEEVDK